MYTCGLSDLQLLDVDISTTALFKVCLFLSKFSNVYKILDLIREQLFTLQKEPQQMAMCLIKVLFKYFYAYKKGYLFYLDVYIGC